MVAALGIPAKFALRQLCASALGHDDWDEGQGQHGQLMPDHGGHAAMHAGCGGALESCLLDAL